MDKEKIINKLQFLENPNNIAGMARFGISSYKTLGVPTPILRKMAKEIGKNHSLDEGLWETGIHEAKLLAAFIDTPEMVTEKQMEEWAKDFDSWDIVDQVCGNLFCRTEHAYKKAFEWSKREEEYVKRAGFVLMATLAVHDKKATDDKFFQFFPIIIREVRDERNYVKKAVNWALRQIGKRNQALRKEAIKTGKKILEIDNTTARWIASDALRELEK